MLFQNSCVVPFGITAIVSFFLFAPGALAPVQLTAATASKIKNNKRVLRMSVFLFRHDWISQTSDTLDQNLHLIARLEKHGRLARKADTGRRAGGDDVAGLERDRLRDELDQSRHAEDQLVRI